MEISKHPDETKILINERPSSTGAKHPLKGDLEDGTVFNPSLGGMGEDVLTPPRQHPDLGDGCFRARDDDTSSVLHAAL